MHSLSTSFVLGYHGCDKAVGERLLAGEPFKASANTCDWLGRGSYFWEANPRRGLDFAVELKNSRRREVKIDMPFVVGAVMISVCAST